MHLANVIVSIGADDPPLLRFERLSLMIFFSILQSIFLVYALNSSALMNSSQMMSSFESSASKAASTCHGVEVCVCECASVARGHAGA